MKKIIFLFLSVFILSCSSNPESHLEHINGYWEIDQVIFTDGSKKAYKYNETIDYININDSLKGFRKKLKPGFNSKYITSDDAEGITIKIENDSLNLYYKTPFSTWKETVLSADENTMKVLNDRETVYIYKRYKPLELDLNNLKMAKRNNENQSLQDVLKEFVSTNNLQSGLDKVNVRDAWANLMGNGVNNYTTAIELKHETLYVQLSSSVLREELSYGKEKIIAMLNEAIGKEVITKLVLR